MRTQLASGQVLDGTLITTDLGDRQVTPVKLALSGIAAGTYAQLEVNDSGLAIAGNANLPWSNISGIPAILPDLSMSRQVAAMSGTSLIPMDNTTPLISEGTQIATVTCTPSSPNSKLAIKGALSVDCGTSNRNLVITAFRDGVCFGAVPMNFVSTGRPQVFPFSFVDTTTGLNYGGAGVVYTLRFGAATACTWYVNRLATQVLNGMMALNNIIFWEYI